MIDSVDQANLRISHLIAPPEEKLSATQGGNILLGYKFGNGYSHKNRSDFELSKAYFAKPLEQYSSKNFRVTDCGGYEVEEVDIDPACLASLKTMDFPVEVNLTSVPKPGFRRLVPMIIGIKPVS
ncbi:hypothetical protein E1189_01435 [Sansalvadorimonas verongulae]|nr:hypothetical protein [Sansalvadorimonas verongulae]